MAIYMMFSFGGVRKVIPPHILAAITITTMIFDVSIPAGMYAIWMMIDPTIQVNSIFIIAILTTIGYSINDTIIVLDRIKENAIEDEEAIVSGKHQVANLIDTSIWQTMRRSLGTSFSTLVVVIMMFLIGDGVIQQFAYVIGWGIIAGTFSSIFISATSLYVLTRKHK
jgi:preprotein translocase SecF subunit